MINKTEMLFYANQVDNYYGFSSGMTTNVNNKTRRDYFISGKPNKKTYSFYLVIVLVFSAISLFIGVTRFKEMSETTSVIVAAISLVLPVIIAIFILIRANKYYKEVEPKPTNLDIYKRDLPSNLRPAHVRMLLKDGKIDEKSVAATLLDLIDKGFIEISKTGDMANIFSDEEIILTRTNKEDVELFKYEKFLIEWFFDKYGDGKSISNLQIKKALRDASSDVSPSTYFKYFQALVTISFPLDRYYTKNKINKKKQITSIIILALSFFGIMFFVGGIFLAYGLGTLMFTMPTYVLNSKGTDEKDNWKDLRKYLLDFSNMKEKTAEMVKLWEFYLTYSVALDIRSVASAELESFFGKEIYNDVPVVSNSNNSSFNIDTNDKLEKFNELAELIKELQENADKRDEELKQHIVEEEKQYNKLLN